MARGGHGGAGLFEPIIKWLRKKVQSSGRHHHVFRGEVRRNRNGTLVGSGYHHRFMGQDPPDRRVTQVRARDVTGAYRANVQMKGPNGWVDKPAGSTFFPDNWTPQEVDRTINDAFASHTPAPGGRRWYGRANGLNIEGSYHRNGKDWDSAWPIVG